MVILSNPRTPATTIHSLTFLFALAAISLMAVGLGGDFQWSTKGRVVLVGKLERMMKGGERVFFFWFVGGRIFVATTVTVGLGWGCLLGCIYFLKQHLKLTDDCLVDGFFSQKPQESYRFRKRDVYNGRPWDAIPRFTHLRAGGLKGWVESTELRRGRGSISDIFLSVSI